MIRNNRGAAAAVTAVALGGCYYYYLNRAGGDVNAAAREMKNDANRARGAIPRGPTAEKAGEKTGLEGGIEEAVSNPRASAKPDERIPEYIADGKSKIGEMRDDAAQRIDKMDRTVEDKASEAKGTLKGWFGGK